MKSSLTIIVPALNEEENLEDVIKKIIKYSHENFNKTEILIYNDGSTDDTGKIADKLEKENNMIKVVHHELPLNLGYIFKDGLLRSHSDYIVMIHGQNDIRPHSLELLFTQKEDIVIPYQVNTFERPLLRALISKAFVKMLNIIFGLNLKYYNHYILFKRELITDLNGMTSSYAFQAEILIKILGDKKISFVEIPFVDDFSNKKKSDAFSVRNIVGVIKFFYRTICEIYFKK
ncbi:MAG: glycosyltransferase family 2 protein [Bacteriovoracaceae bacterium]|mgnify:CR=1 FL=1|jgi:dolichol-phosphate mannosyltransferase|nr:glycosyltransferase family 2 protein [Bacteriovoracaceae bacterium]